MKAKIIKISSFILIVFIVAYLLYRSIAWYLSDDHQYKVLSEAIAKSPKDTSLIRQRIYLSMTIDKEDSLNTSDLYNYISLGGNDPVLLNYQASVELFNNNPNLARQNIKELIKRGGTPYLILGQINMELGNYDEAIEAYSKIRETRDSNDVNEYLADGYTMQGGFNEAKVFWRKKVGNAYNQYDSSRVFKKIIVLEILTKSYSEALFDIENWSKIYQTDQHDINLYKSIIKIKQMEYQAAEDILKEINRKDNSAWQSYFLLHTIYLRTQKIQKAMEYLDTSMIKGFGFSDLIETNLIPAKYNTQFKLVLKKHSDIIVDSRKTIALVLNDRFATSNNNHALNIACDRLDIVPLYDDKVNEFVELYRRIFTVHFPNP